MDSLAAHLLAVVRSLGFAEDRAALLRDIDDAGWRRLIPLLDRSQLALPLGVRCRGALPAWVRDRIDRNLANNAIRHRRAVEASGELSRALASRAIPFVILKGLAHGPDYCGDPRWRPQFDVDLYCPPGSIGPAFEAVSRLGYEPFGAAWRDALDHLPPMIRKTGWRPRGDYYDPEMPLTVELHFRLWDRETECLDVSGAEHFWDRREYREAGGLRLPFLHPADELSYTAWHLMRHLLRGDLRAYHLYELAHFLDRTSDRAAFWTQWRGRGPHDVIECIAFRLAQEWFECRLHPAARDAARALPDRVERWISAFAFSPLAALGRPNKDELFLHLSLLERPASRLRILKRRLLPSLRRTVIVDAHVPAPDLRLRLKRVLLGSWFVARRVCYHALTLAPVLSGALRWRRANRRQTIPQSRRRPAEIAAK